MAKAVPTFKKFNTDDRNLMQLQSNVSEALSSVLPLPLLNGVLLQKVALGAGANSVNHQLDRLPLGCIIVSQSNAATIYDNIAAGTASTTTVTLTASGSVNVNLWVF